MGFFRKERSSPPPVNMTPVNPIQATPSTPPINFMQIYDTISGKNFSFVNGVNGERYLQLKGELAEAEKGTTVTARSGKGGFWGSGQSFQKTARDEGKIASCC